MAVCIRAHAVVLLAQRIHPVPACGDGIVLPCAVVVGVEAVHPVQFLAVILALLHVAGRGAVAELRAKGVVVHRLDDRPVRGAVGLDYLADAAEMVLVIVVEKEVVLAVVAGVLLRLAVALPELELVDAPVPQREASPEEVVRGVRAQNLRGGKLPEAADGDGDVRDRRQVRDAQLLPRGAILVLRHAAVCELDADGVVEPVVVYPRYPAPGIVFIDFIIHLLVKYIHWVFFSSLN